MRSLNAPRTKTGCWTCRARKIKCDETKPQCTNCRPRNRPCQYGYRPRRKRRPDTTAERLQQPLIAPADPVRTSPTLSLPVAAPPELPYGLQSTDWPLPLNDVDKQALHHYVDTIVPRMVLKSPRWSTYSYVLFMCTRHSMLAHLLLAFLIRDMTESHEGDETSAALEHYQEALALFIWHLGHPDVQAWVTFPALWLFILYEQTYGEDSRVLQAHLRGLCDMIRSDGSSILSLSVDSTSSNDEVPREFLNRLALWTVHYDARASTFGLDGGIVDLLNEKYPGAMALMCETSKDGLRAAWGSQYPAAEDVWDAQIDPLWTLDHKSVMLRYKLSTLERRGEGDDSSALRQFGSELKALEIEFSPFIPLAKSRALERSTQLSNTCAAVANFLALVILYDRLMYDIQSPAVSSVLSIIASLHEYEGDPYLWHVAWALFVVAFETNDPIHQVWILERFTHMQKNGRHMGRARALLESLFLEKRRSSGRLRYSVWIRDGRLMPLLGVTYLLQFLDKISLGYSALLNLRADLGLRGSEYSWATAIFYFGYFFWTFPTSWLIIRLPLGKYLASVVIVWGAVLACHAACKGFAGLMVTRFVLGMLGASIAPGSSCITGMLYKRDEQPLRHGIWYLGNSAVGLFGGVLAWGIGHINGALWPWQYLFIIFGCITSAWGLVLLVFLPDAPSTARFLTSEERFLAVERTSETRQKVDGKEFKIYQVWEALRDPQAWLLCLNMLGCMLVNSGLSAVCFPDHLCFPNCFENDNPPTIVLAICSSWALIIIAGFGYSGLQALLYQMPGAAVQIGLVILCSLCGSYIQNCRTILLAALRVISIIGTVLVYILDDSQRDAKLFGASIMGAFACALPISMSIVSTNIVGNTKKTVVSAMLFVAYCVGNIVSPQVFLASEETRYPTGIKVCLAGLALGVCIGHHA